MNGRGVRVRLAVLLAALLLGATPATAATAETGITAETATTYGTQRSGAPSVTVDRPEAARGAGVTVSGKGWRPGALLTLLVCGQNMIGGTNACANAEGRTVTTAPDGTFRRDLPVAAPPEPCPCVVHVATVTGEPATADAAFSVTGHPVEPLPQRTGGERLSVLDARLEGGGSLLTWFGAPPKRRLVVTVANLGPTPAVDPAFRLGTSRGVLAPSWEDRPWRGTVAAGGKERVSLDVELAAGAYGDHLVSLQYGGTVLVEQPWDVSRPWGVTLFWILLCVVVPLAVFRAGMAVVDRLRPRTPARAAPGPGGVAATPSLPWFTPASGPPAAPRQDPGEGAR
ncbi:hypothetical protein LE181_15960 [Streptomyces sp. SCA3-4]|uniref:hypothetical protein n=1 Tax=Streptomyces sichuanensis TaxID=2871810 RepID=UPI001CE25ACD|nr:hypothetical protein [Streptomyces sichuanensis]MCA6093649.1 hypothetical protein [Streptomyces sichuanensis]